MNRNDRAVVGLVALAHAAVHTYELSVPILVTIWLDEFAVGAGTLGVVVAAGYALFGLGALPGGVLADAYGSRRLIAACLAGMGGSFLLLAAAPSLPVVGLALASWGAAASVYHPAGLSLISTGVADRGRGFAYHGMAGNVGIALGPLATTLLLLAVDWRTAAALLAVPAGVAALLALRIDVDETAAVAATDGGSDAANRDAPVASTREVVSGVRSLFAGAFLAVFGVVMLSGLYYRGALTFLPELLAGLPAFGTATVAGVAVEPSRYLYAGLLTVGVGGQYLGGRLTDRVRKPRAIAVGFGVLAAVSVAYVPAMTAGTAWLLAASAALGFALFTVQPLYQALVAEFTPADSRGLSYGVTYLGVFGVGALGAGVAGAAVDFGGPAALFAVLAGIAATGATLAAALAWRTA